MRLAVLELLFAAPAGRAQCPPQSSSPKHRTNFLRASTQTTTKLFRRWQPPRVTSTTNLQLDHLVPLDVISQCNRTRITHSQSDRTLTSTSELEGSQTLSSMDTKSPKVLNLSHGQDTPLFIAHRPNRAVIPFLRNDRTHCRDDQTRQVIRVQSLLGCHMS